MLSGGGLREFTLVDTEAVNWLERQELIRR